MPLNSFSLLLQTLRQFIKDRNWEQFHTPRNISLALTGECGELSAIFQWKSDSGSIFHDEFTAKELVHLGEEISDVFIYNLRLSDVIGIDLIKAIKFVLDASSTDQNFRQTPNQTSADMTFAEALLLINNSASTQTIHSSVRDILFDLNSCQGKISHHFSTNGSANPRVEQWPEEHFSVAPAHFLGLPRHGDNPERQDHQEHRQVPGPSGQRLLQEVHCLFSASAPLSKTFLLKDLHVAHVDVRLGCSLFVPPRPHWNRAASREGDR
jgi:dCTP diphosphatase